MRNAVLTVFAVLLAIPASAQNAAQDELSAPKEVSLSGLSSRVMPNDRLYVRRTSGGEIEGRFAGASDDTLTLRVDGQVREIPVSEVLEVSRRTNHVGKGMLIGFISGAAVAVGVIAAGGESDAIAVGLVAGGGTGLAWGALIGAFIHTYPVVYRAAAPTVRLTPVFSPGRSGVVLIAAF